MQTKAFVERQARLEELVREKDKFMVEFRKQARLLTSEIEEYLAEKRMRARVESLNPAERQALAAELAKEGGS